MPRKKGPEELHWVPKIERVNVLKYGKENIVHMSTRFLVLLSVGTLIDHK